MTKMLALLAAAAALISALFSFFTPQQGVKQVFPAAAVEGPVTTYQTGGGFIEPLYIPTDSVMVYTLDPGHYANWVEKSEHYTIDMMIAINRADTSYTDAPPGHRDEVQTRKDGSLLNHPSSASVFYMVPTQGFIDYLCDSLEKCLAVKAPRMVALEEPEIFDDAGYSASFKAEWQSYYGEPWKDPASSPQARYQASRLKVHLFERAVTEVSARVKAVCPQTKIVIATHSTVNYDNYGITAGIDHYAALPGVDGIIGQTWSDTARMKLRFNGADVSDVYSYAALEYASYVDTVEDIDFYALADPKADNPDLSWADYESLYRDTVAAQLMQPEIQRFEVLPWPDRSFLAAPDEYKTKQLNVFAALQRLSGKAVALSAGSPRVALGISDTLSWHDEKTSKKPLQAVEGLSVPLIRDGIALKTKSLDFIRTPADLADTDVLILSYEVMKPASARTNEAVAQWVKGGGIVLYIGGHDAMEKAPGYWWSDATPLGDLLGRLGLDGIEAGKPKSLPSMLRWTGGRLDALDRAKVGAVRLRAEDCAFNAAFTGDVNTVLRSGGDSVGIDQPAGEGRFIAFGFPAYLTSTLGGADLMRAAAKYALSYTGSPYNRQNLVRVERGDITAAHAFNKAATLKGRYIDLFDSELGILGSVEVAKGGSCLLCDISGLDLSVPRLAFTGGRLTAPAQETADSTVFTVAGPVMADISARLVCAPGTCPQSVTASRGGKTFTPYLRWDEASSSLLVQFEGAVAGVQIDVRWGTQPADVTNAKPPARIVIPVNNKNLDAAYIYQNTAFANDSLRFADGDTQLVYRFNLADFSNPDFTLEVFQNYLIDVSADGVHYTVTHDYSLIDPSHPRTGGNNVLVTFDPDDYGAQTEFYIRIRNNDPSTGWGGSVRLLVIRQYAG